MTTPTSSFPDVSVVIATRNRPELLTKAVDAILGQDYPGAIDITLVYDQTEVDAARNVNTPGRSVKATANSRQPGLPGARNCGMANSVGEIVAFCDDDDEWLPGKLRRQIDELSAHPDCAFVTTGIRVTFDGERHDRPSPVTTLSLEHLLHDRTTEAHPSSFLFRRDLISMIGEVDEEIPGGYSEDYDFLLRAAKATTVRCIVEPLTLVRWHQASFFSDRWSMIVDAQRYLLKKHPEFHDHRKAEARIRGQVAFALAAIGDRRKECLREVGAVVGRWPLERRWPVALAVVSKAIKPGTALKLAHKAGRGI